MSTELTLKTTVRELVATLQHAEEVVRRTFAEIHEAEERCNALFVLGGTRSMRVEPCAYGNGADWTDPEQAIERLRREAWQCVVERLELRRVLSDASWRALEEELKSKDVQPVTEETIAKFVQRFTGDLPALFAAKVTEVFDWLRPREHTPRAEYKTNQKNAREVLGEKIVASHIVEEGWGRDKFRVCHYAQQRLAALESVFRSLDGQGYSTGTYYGELSDAIGKSDGEGETIYFKFRVFKNGNMHLTFKRLDLLSRLNAMAGGKNLSQGEAASSAA